MIDFFNPETLNNLFFSSAKIFFIILSLLYTIFALIVVKQVNSMSKSIADKFNPILILFSFIHLVFSGILVLSMFAL